MKITFQASLLTKKVSICLFLFLMKVTGQVPCWFHDRAIFSGRERHTQHHIELGLSENFSTSGLLMVLKLAKISPFAHELR